MKNKNFKSLFLILKSRLNEGKKFSHLKGCMFKFQTMFFSFLFSGLGKCKLFSECSLNSKLSLLSIRDDPFHSKIVKFST